MIEILTIHVAQRIVYRAFSLLLQLKILNVDKTASKWLLKQRESKHQNKNTRWVIFISIFVKK